MAKSNSVYAFRTRPWLTPIRLIILTSLFVVACGNAAFFNQVLAVYPWQSGNIGFVISLGVLLTCVLVLLLSLFSALMPVRIVASLILLLAAGISFFSDTFGTIIDTEMLYNLLETDSAEAGDLLSGGFLLHIFLFGVLPVIAIWALPIKRTPYLYKLGQLTLTIVATAFIALVCLYSYSDTYAGFFRQQKQLRYYTNPTFAIYSAAKLVAEQNTSSTPTERVAVAEDARLPETDPEHELIVMVVGETARRDRFSLNGYARETNPRLAKEKNLVSYSNIVACGTSTRTSVPCMFSSLDREDFSNDEADRMENVLDVLQRVGISILWRDNNSSSKGVADRVLYEDFKTPDINPVCDTECRDIGMLHGLQEFIDTQDSDILIVLHQMGNHGPAYFKRYPNEFERFTPACQSEELANCSLEEIDNAYDNAILYTDYFLSQVIALLKSNTDRFETAMLYVSDHGESLGENGVYLHGLPYIIAPKEQIDVPVIAWIGDSSDVDLRSAINLKNETNSHDAVFHALLELFEVESEEASDEALLFELNEQDDDHNDAAPAR